MGSMHTGLKKQKGGFEKMAVFYAERARGGARFDSNWWSFSQLARLVKAFFHSNDQKKSC